MSKLAKRLSVIVCLLVVQSSCIQPPPTSAQQPGPPTVTETPLFGDADIDNAISDITEDVSLDGSEDTTIPNDGATEVSKPGGEGELSAQAVLSGARGFVVYIWNDPADTIQPWRIYRHNEVTDANTLVYGGLREISSVAVTGNGNTLVVSMRETTTGTSDFEVYQIVVSPQTVTQLTSNTGSESNVSMSGSAGFYAWEDDSTTAGVRNVLLRNNTVSPTTTIRLSATINQTQPSISNDGRFITMMRRDSTNNNYLIMLYNRAANTYTTARSVPDVMEHPSVSNNAEKIAWLQKTGMNNLIFVRDIAANTNTQVLSTTDQLNHPHLSADGLTLTFAQQVTGIFNVYTRNLTTNLQVKAVTSTVNNTAPYWQFPVAGTLDTTFGTAGKVTTNFGSDVDYAAAVILDASNRLVVAGGRLNGNTMDFVVARYTTNGSLDTTFGTGGIVTTDIASSNDIAKALILDNNNRLVVAGESDTSSDGSNHRFALVRYNADGTLDATFGTGGKVTTDVSPSYDYVGALLLDQNNRLVVTGDGNFTHNRDVALVRYNTNGTLDTTFGTGGIVRTDFGTIIDSGHALIRDNNNKLIVAGSKYDQVNSDVILARYNVDGTLDTTFGTGGKVSTNLGSNRDEANALIRDSSNRLIIAGTNGTFGDIALARYSTNGTLDTTFGSSGIVTTGVATNNDSTNALIIDYRGRLVVAGTSASVNNGQGVLVRYNPSGTLDTSFSTTGVVTINFGAGRYRATALLQDRTNRLVVVGNNDNNSDVTLVRYWP
jgi:uncharacterized delta-60 repeat protein